MNDEILKAMEAKMRKHPAFLKAGTFVDLMMAGKDMPDDARIALRRALISVWLTGYQAGQESL